MSSGRGRHLSGWLAAAAAVCIIGGLAAYVLQTPTAVPVSDGEAVAPQTVAGQVKLPTPQTPSTFVPGAPRRVVIPALDVAVPSVPIKAAGSTLIPPADPQELGWWADGARPGAERGSALVTGHTVHTGGGALDDLETLTEGDTVVVRTDRGKIRYAVAAVRIFSKGRLANHAERLFSQEVPGRLVLITCEDWDGERYLSNVVVTAKPVR